MNGRDVSQSSHEEAVAAFLTASEPITVEVLRRPEATAPNFGGKIQTGTSVSVPVSLETIYMQAIVALLIGITAAAIPAFRSAQVPIVEGLRSIG